MASSKSLLLMMLFFVLGVIPSMARMILFRDVNFNGSSVTLVGSVSNIGLGGPSFNDEASSMVITKGEWQIFEHALFTGRSSIRGPGRYPNPRAMGIRNDELSSVLRLR